MAKGGENRPLGEVPEPHYRKPDTLRSGHSVCPAEPDDSLSEFNYRPSVKLGRQGVVPEEPVAYNTGGNQRLRMREGGFVVRTLLSIIKFSIKSLPLHHINAWKLRADFV